MKKDETNIVPIIPPEVSLRRQKGRGFLIGRGVVFLLNSSAVTILELCDGKKSIRDILTNLRGYFISKQSDDIQSQVVTFIKGLAETHVILIKEGEGDSNVSRSR